MSGRECVTGLCLTPALTLLARLREIESGLDDRRLADECDAELIQTHRDEDA
ncbi:hypothetical protein [Caulobacter segnis]|uniref:hypothetical protein n=1 Tax=Caulobacter segnis TaxID=88688 RepID=UPI0026B4B913|nr:hypothetical protein [Caulobacter segnis]